MTITIRDTQQAVTDKIKTREIKHNPFKAVIVPVHGSIYPDNRPSLVWIAESAQPESRHIALSGNISPVENLPVWVQKSPKPPNQLEIIGVYAGAMDPSETISPFQVPLHAPNHQMPSESNLGIDPVKVYQPAIQMLKTTGNGSDLTVYTQEYIYQFGNTYQKFSGYFSDMTTYLPSAGMILWVLLYFDPSTGVINYLSGNEVAIGLSPARPSIPDNVRASAFILLEDGQTEIVTAEHILDTRDFLGGGGLGSSATEIGQIMYSTDGVSFTAELPMVNSDGILLTSEGYIMVV